MRFSRPSSRPCRRGSVAALAVLALAAPIAAQVDCNLDPGTTTVETLQRARARLGASHQTPFARADCARDMVRFMATPEPCSDACLRELVGLYKDAAVYERRAHDAARTAENRRDYAKREIDARSKLHDLLKSDAKGIDRDGNDLRRNFADLADIFEIESEGRRYHELISGDEVRAKLGPKAFEVWARALRSCSAWNFTAGTDRDQPKLLRELCADGCRPELKKLEDTLPSTSPEARVKAENLVPMTAQCPAAP